MARTPLLHSLTRLSHDIRLARSSGLSVEAVRELRAEHLAGSIDEPADRDPIAARPSWAGPTRRQFLGGAAVAAGAMLVARPLFAAKKQPRVAIIGGGMAGLTAALELADHGYTSTIFEAQTIGGRVRSEGPAAPGCGNCHGVSFHPSDTFADGQVAELFGEFIDTDHMTMRRLAGRFHLPLTNLLKAEPKGSTDSYLFFGQRYSARDAEKDFEKLFPVLQADADALGGNATWDDITDGGRALDSMSIWDWIESRVEGGHASPLGALLDVAYNIEYGAETRDQSAINLVFLLSGARKKRFTLFGASDEKFQIAGGNQQLPRAMAQHLQQRGAADIRLGAILDSIARLADGSYQLDLRNAAPFVADLVLLALPFSALRGLDYSRAGFDAHKDMAIRALGAGKNGKVYLQFRSRLWNQPGPWGVSNGNAYSDTGFQTTWDGTRGQSGASGILCKYTGGDVASAMHINHPYGGIRNATVAADAAAFLAQIEPVYPGLSALWNGRGMGTQAHLSPLFGSSYAYFRVGQYQTVAGYEGVTQNGVLFAGEHTSIDYQGYMEGAAAEGERAGKDLVRMMKKG